MLIETLGDLRNNTSFLRTVFELLDLPNKMEKGDTGVSQNSDTGYEIEFRNVSFRYPDQEDYAPVSYTHLDVYKRQGYIWTKEAVKEA